MSVSLGEHYLAVIQEDFRKTKAQGDRTFAQLQEEHYFWKPSEDSNSIAHIVQHVSGNMRSRWTDFLTTDGEKADRNRDSEFEDVCRTSSELLDRWERGWVLVFDAMKGLKPEDLMKTVMIRGEAHTVVQAIQRQIRHYAGHVEQIVQLGKMIRGSSWHTLSIPKRKPTARR